MALCTSQGRGALFFAVDLRTHILWKYNPQVPKSFGEKGCCDVVNRGVALYDNKIYVGTFDGRLIALDSETGAKIWEVLTVDQSKPYTITGAPRVIKGKVIIGNGGAELGVRGYFSAYDAEGGGGVAPDLGYSAFVGTETFDKVALEGVLLPNGMPKFDKRLTKEDTYCIQNFIINTAREKNKTK